MKTTRKTLLITSILIMAAIWGFVVLEKGTNLFKGLDLVIFILIVLFGVIAMVRALKVDKEEREGLAVEDELSNQLKYKSGYYAYLVSMYMWLFIFLLKDNFPDVEMMLGGGILLSGLIAFISKVVVKHSYYDQ